MALTLDAPADGEAGAGAPVGRLDHDHDVLARVTTVRANAVGSRSGTHTTALWTDLIVMPDPPGRWVGARRARAGAAGR